MQEYEIRILRADKTTATVIEVMHLNDNAAIRSARAIANGQAFEVWRGLDCVYGRDYPCHAPAQPPPAPRP